MDKILPEIAEIIQKDSINDTSYKQKIPELMEKISNLPEQSEKSQVINILLNFIKGRYDVIGLNIDKVTKLYEQKIENLLTKINNHKKQYLPNATSEFYLLKNSSKDDVIIKLCDIAAKEYKKQQIKFISTFYKTINFDNLKALIGDDYAKRIIEERAWKLEKNFVIINNTKEPGNFDGEKIAKDIEFFGNSNLMLNKLIKEHGKLIEYENK